MRLFDSIRNIFNKSTPTTPPAFKDYFNEKVIPLITQDMSHFSLARGQALLGRRAPLLEVYERAMIDAHLQAVLQQRFLAVLSKPYNLTNDKGEIAEESSILGGQWFKDFLQYSLESAVWGFSLCQITGLDHNYIPTAIELVPRRHVKPELQIIVNNISDDKGIDYASDEFINYVIQIGKNDDLGLMLNATPDIIAKRITHTAYLEHVILFSNPKMIIKTPLTDNAQKQDLINSLENMNRASFAVIDSNDEAQFFLNTNSSNPYPQAILLSTENISKLFLGQTMTTESGSSLSQAQIHQNTLDMIIGAECKRLESCVNDLLLPRLIALGARLDGLSFRFDNTERVDTGTRVQWLCSLLDRGYTVDDGYVATLTGIPAQFTLPTTTEVLSAKK